MPATPALDILVLDDEPNIRRTLSLFLEGEGYRVQAVAAPADALRAIEEQPYDVAFVDLRLGTASGLDVIPELVARLPGLKIIVITAYASIESAVEAVKRGANEYLPKPFTPAQIELVLGKVLAVRTLEQKAEGHPRFASEPDEIESRSPAMKVALDLARQVAASDATVLLGGESGTGKGVLARAIHRWSSRADRPFVTISCPSLSPDLLESELFGSVKGAFTDARNNPGKIGVANGGTLLLDEIGELPANLQPKLLRFLQDREYERVGDPHARRADVRVIGATNRDLGALVADGRFREDLFYRLNVFPIVLPSLRDRKEDIPFLAERFRAEFSRQYARPVERFTGEALATISSANWPGNVRELRNAIERAVILASGPAIGVEHLPHGAASATSPADGATLRAIEEAHIRHVLANAPSLEDAARTLGIDPATLWRKRKKYGL